jgi:type IX secretion system substrate protein
MMKKLLTLFALIPVVGFGQIFSENFEGGTFPPTGWTTQDLNANDNWMLYEDTPITGDYSASVEYDEALGQQDEWLISPVIDLSTATAAFLEFNVSLSYYWSIDPNDNYDVVAKVSPDGGTTWVDVWSEADAGVFDNFTPFLASVDISSYIGNANVKIAFQYIGSDGAQWVLDDIVIAEEQTPPPVPPVNDDCAGALSLTAGGDFAANAVTGTSIEATTVATLPECQDASVADVWYTVVVPASGTLTIETQAVDGSDVDDTIIEVYTGTCAGLTAIGCNDDNEDDDETLFSKVVLADLTPGATLYVSVWQYDGFFGSAEGEFLVSAYDASLKAPSFDESQFSFYPNPVQNSLNLAYNEVIDDVTIYNLMGQKVFTKTMNAATGEIDLSALASGNYVVKVTSADTMNTIKIVKQ